MSAYTKYFRYNFDEKVQTPRQTQHSRKRKKEKMKQLNDTIMIDNDDTTQQPNLLFQENQFIESQVNEAETLELDESRESHDVDEGLLDNINEYEIRYVLVLKDTVLYTYY